jgi:hypothetical protein
MTRCVSKIRCTPWLRLAWVREERIDRSQGGALALLAVGGLDLTIKLAPRLQASN